MDVVTEERLDRLEAATQSLTLRMGEVESHVIGRAQPLSGRPQATWSVTALGPVEPVTAVPSCPSPVPQAADARSLAPSLDPARDRPRQPPELAQWFDDLLGGRMLAWLGGLAVLVGIVLFFTYAASRGWLGPWARVGCGALGSCGLLGFGLRLHARGGRTEAARTLVAVALSGLFVTVVVASRVYGLIPGELGVPLAMCVGALATYLAVRWDARVIAALGILGALLAPILVGAPDDLGTLLVLAAGAASAVGVLLWRRWDWLAFLALLACAVQWLPWLLNRSTGPGMAAALLVLVIFGVIGHLAAIGFELRMPAASLRPASSLLLVLNIAVLAIAGYATFADASHVFAGQLWIAGLAVGHFGLADAARRTRRVSADVTLLLLSVAVLLGDAAFAFLASGPALAVGWAVIGVGFAYLLAHRAGSGHGRQLAGIGLGGHLFSGLIVAVCQPGQLSFGGAGVGGTLAVAALAAGSLVSGQLTGSVSRRGRDLLQATGLVLIAYLSASTVSGAGLAVAWALEAVALAAVARRSDDQVAAVGSLLFLTAAGVYAGTVEAPLHGLVFGIPDLGAAAASLTIVSVGSLAVARVRLTVLGRSTMSGLIASGLLGLLYLASVAIVTAFQPHDAAINLGGLDLAVRQQGQLVLSALWGVVGVGVLITGLRRDQRLLRLGGLVLLLITALKVAVYDLSTLDSVYRISSFIAVGLLLLAGAHAYQRMRPLPAGRPGGVR